MARTRPHFKVHLSLQSHRRAVGVYADNDLLAMFVRIGMMAVERFAAKTDDSFTCSGLDLERLAGCRGVANARRRLARLVDVTRITLVEEGGHTEATVRPEGGHAEATARPRGGQRNATWRLTMPNLSRKQGFQHENSTGTAASESESESESESDLTTSSDPPTLAPPAPELEPSTQALWDEYNEARRAYLPKATGLQLSKKWRSRMAIIRKSFGKTAHVDAVHGAIACALGTDWDATRHLSPDTLWQDGKIPKYLAADADAQAAGILRPYSDREYKRQSTEATIYAAMHALANPGERNR